MGINWIYNRLPPYERTVRVMLDDDSQCHAYFANPRGCQDGWHLDDGREITMRVVAWCIDPVYDTRQEIGELEQRLKYKHEELQELLKEFGEFAL
ncbi:hypothetical protein [Edwardsiella phage PVN06]|nr:hypothetical protein [Edwardsiella phage PVN06]